MLTLLRQKTVQQQPLFDDIKQIKDMTYFEEFEKTIEEIEEFTKMVNLDFFIINISI